MFDAAPPVLQRVRGRAEVAFAPRLRRLAQAGSARAVLPGGDGPAGGCREVVFLNTAGGLTSGDRLDFALSALGGAAVTATTQTAERAYRAPEGPARVGVRLAAGPGARLAWLPQETILFDGAALDRDTLAEIDGSAELLLAESLTLGRAAMGETVRRLDLRDRRRVVRDGRLAWLEPFALDGAALAAPGPSTLDGQRALLALALFAPGAEDALGPVRADLATLAAGVAGASAWDGRLLVRAAAPDPAPLRRLYARLAARLLRGPVPRVWQG